MKQNNFLKKALTLVGAAVIAGAVGLGASNHSQADAASAQTEVHLVKYAISGDATPKQADGYAEDADLANKDVVAGAEFSVYDVTDKYWENYDAKLKGKSANEVSTLLNATIPDKDGNPTRNAFFDTPADGETESAFNPDNAFKSGTTDENGKIDFTLDNYNDAGQYKVYLFREESVPAGYAKSADFVLSLPAKGTDDNKSPLTEAWVYPKDQVTGNYQLKFTKVDANNSDVAHNMLSGAIFYITKSETKTVDGEEKTVTKYAQVNGITGQDEAGKDNTLKGFEADQAVVKWVDKDKATKFESGDNGEFGFAAATESVKNGDTYGLSETGKYAIEEETAPKGYNKDAAIKGNEKDDLSVKTETVTTNDETATAPAGYTVTDTPEGILPHTGGAGIIAIVAAGLAITVIGVAAYSKRRANA